MCKDKREKRIGRKKCKEVEEEYKLKQRNLILKTLEKELETLDNKMKIDDKIIHETQLQRKKLKEEIMKTDECKYIIMNININRVYRVYKIVYIIFIFYVFYKFVI